MFCIRIICSSYVLYKPQVGINHEKQATINNCDVLNFEKATCSSNYCLNLVPRKAIAIFIKTKAMGLQLRCPQLLYNERFLIIYCNCCDQTLHRRLPTFGTSIICISHVLLTHMHFLCIYYLNRICISHVLYAQNMHLLCTVCRCIICSVGLFA